MNAIRSRTAGAFAAIAGSICFSIFSTNVNADNSRELNLDEQPLADSLKNVADEFGLEIAFFSDTTEGLEAVPLTGNYTSVQAFDALLRDTSLEHRQLDNGTVVVRRKQERGDSDSKNLIQTSVSMAGSQESRTKKPNEEERDSEKAASNDQQTPESRGIPDFILVIGSRNANIRRYEDDPQPYVVFDSDEIANSLAPNLEEFFRTRLPQNASTLTNRQDTSSLLGGNTSSIDLRGLGSDQTLILINGRRAPSLSNVSLGAFQQPDINGIPLSAIERIEVLPTTASGIYGGGATGGAINIVLKRDYGGWELVAKYENTFDGGAIRRGIDLSGGFDLEEGRTSVLFTAGFSASTDFLTGDRGFAQQARALALANAPDQILASSVPPLGATTNISSVGTLDLDRFLSTGEVAFTFPDLTFDDGTPLGSSFTSVPSGYAGPQTDGGAALLANAGSYNLAIPDGDPGLSSALLGAPKTKAATLSVRRELTERIEAFVDISTTENENTSTVPIQAGTFAQIPADAPNNPFDTDIVVTYPTVGPNFENTTSSSSLGVSGGLLISLPASWNAEAYYGWNRTEAETIATTPAVQQVFEFTGGPFSDGTLDVLRDVNEFPIDFSQFLLPSPNLFYGPAKTTLENTSLRLAGPASRIAGGLINVTALLEYREEIFETSFRDQVNAFVPPFDIETTHFPRRGQEVLSFYLESVVPIVSSYNARRGAELLELQASIRRDEYTTRSVDVLGNSLVDSRNSPLPQVDLQTNKADSTDYTFAIRYSPVNDVILRASYGTGFVAPSLPEVAATEVLNTFGFFSDPRRENTPVPVVLQRALFGGSPALRPEESESLSVGVILTPRFLQGLRVSVDYTSIEKTDEIGSIDAQFILDNEDIFGDRLVRGELTQADLDLGFTAGPVLELDQTLTNIARTRVKAIDFQLNYDWNSQRFGDFSFYAIATRSMEFFRQFRPDLEGFDFAGFSGGPLTWRGNAGINWTYANWALGWNAQYYDKTPLFVGPQPGSREQFERDIARQGAEHAPSQIYHDAFLRYRFDVEGRPDVSSRSLLSGLELAVGIQNVLDKSPPIIASAGPVQTTGGYSTFGDPRLRRYSISLRKGF